MQITIIGAGLAGLSAARTLAQQNIPCSLVSVQTSERAQSVLAEGGINAALNLMGEDDSPEQHFHDTMAGGRRLADPEAVRGLTEAAPGIVRELSALGVPFAMSGKKMLQRYFGGQKKRRTAYCKSSTGKALMTAMIDAVRQYEGTLITRYPHHKLESLILNPEETVLRTKEPDNSEELHAEDDSEHMACNGRCLGAVIRDLYSGEKIRLTGPVILAFGGPCGLFPGMTTGTTANDADALAQVYSQGVALADLEFIQYHPTTVQIPGKRLLISEAARGEGGRLFVMRGEKRWYFMEELYPELGNLMPRDVISAEMEAVVKDDACGDQVYLDLTGLSKEIWRKRLSDLHEQTIRFLGLDPARKPIPVSPGIHFFMGGIDVDRQHRTNIEGLYAAGECACQYHGANRLGGNSLLGAIYGGRVAAMTAAENFKTKSREPQNVNGFAAVFRDLGAMDGAVEYESSPQITEKICGILVSALGITRCESELTAAQQELRQLLERPELTEMDRKRILLGEAFVKCALERRESRGAHRRSDYPQQDDTQYLKRTIVRKRDPEEIRVQFMDPAGKRCE